MYKKLNGHTIGFLWWSTLLIQQFSFKTSHQLLSYFWVMYKNRITRQSKVGHIVGGDAVRGTRKRSAVHWVINLASKTCFISLQTKTDQKLHFSKRNMKWEQFAKPQSWHWLTDKFHNWGSATFPSSPFVNLVLKSFLGTNITWLMTCSPLTVRQKYSKASNA